MEQCRECTATEEEMSSLEGHREGISGGRPKQKATSLPQLSPGWQPMLSSCPAPNPHILYLQSIPALAFCIQPALSQVAEGQSHGLHKNCFVFFFFEAGSFHISQADLTFDTQTQASFHSQKSVCLCPSTHNILTKTDFGHYAGLCEHGLDTTVVETS